jgi:hypothetical protein
MGRISILISVLLLSLSVARAQKFPAKGVPLIDSYVPEAYGTPGKAWSIRSAANGIVYFASDRGLLEFDGRNWQLFPGSKGFTRSLLIASDTVFYSGADKDFGRWHRDELQHFAYRSLYPFRESTKGLNEEFWGVHRIGEALVFVSFDNLYVYQNEQLTKIAAPTRFTESFFSGDKIYLADAENGLFEFDGLTLSSVFPYPATPLQIVGVQKNDAGLLVVTRNQGLFQYRAGSLTPLDHEVSPYLVQDQVFCFTPIDDTHYAFGTILNGVYITDRAGRIIQHVNKQKGLPNNTVLSLHYSRQGKLWLGLDFGIAAIHLWSDLSYVLDYEGRFGTSQTALLEDSLFYLGTNQGLYVTEWSRLKNDARGTPFTLVPGSAGQVWSLQRVEGTILCGHDRGLFRVVGKTLVPVHDEPGVLAIRPLGDGHLLTGNYNGVSLFRRSGNSWSFVRKLPPVLGACYDLEVVHDDTLWVNIPNYGVIRATLGESYAITDQRIFPADEFAGERPKLFQNSQGVGVQTSTARYVYRPNRQAFAVADSLPQAPRIRNRLPGAYRPTLLDSAYAFFPAYNGFALQNIRRVDQPPPGYPLAIRSLAAFNNDTLQTIAPQARVPYSLNNLRIQYIVPQQEAVSYRYRLANHTTTWSNWSPQPYVDFLDLQEGTYTLHVEAKVRDRVLAPRSVTFSVAPPWYRTGWAYGGYLLLAGLLFYGNFLWQRGRLRRQRMQLLAQEQESLRRQAANYQRDRLVQERQALEAELKEAKQQLRSKTIDLAKKAKESQDKNRLLRTLQEKIAELEKESAFPKSRWSPVRRLLESALEESDETFNIQLEELHEDFLAQLQARYPELTTYDLRLCTYLKTGLSTREIAGIMNVLPSSVNVSRSRLRKKLQLDPKEDLFKFLNSFS